MSVLGLDRKRLAVRVWVAVAAGMLGPLAGCAPEPELVEQRLEVVSAVPLDDATSITEAVESITSVDADAAEPTGNVDGRDQIDVVSIRGRVGAGDLPAFDPDKAAFLVSEIIEDPNGGQGHDPSTCPFCKRRAEKAPRVMVTLVDDSGDPLSEPADELLALDVGDTVQVRGDVVRFNPELNTLELNAKSIHTESH